MPTRLRSFARTTCCPRAKFAMGRSTYVELVKFIRYDGDHIVPKTEFPIAIVRLPSSRALQPRTPPTTPCVLETIRDTKWDTSSREPNFICLEKKFLGIIQRLQLIRLQLQIQMNPALWVRQRGLPNPLGKPSRAAKHQPHDQIARWIF